MAPERDTGYFKAAENVDPWKTEDYDDATPMLIGKKPTGQKSSVFDSIKNIARQGANAAAL